MGVKVRVTFSSVWDIWHMATLLIEYLRCYLKTSGSLSTKRPFSIRVVPQWTQNLPVFTILTLLADETSPFATFISQNKWFYSQFSFYPLTLLTDISHIWDVTFSSFISKKKTWMGGGFHILANWIPMKRQVFAGSELCFTSDRWKFV